MISKKKTKKKNCSSQARYLNNFASCMNIFQPYRLIHVQTINKAFKCDVLPWKVKALMKWVTLISWYIYKQGRGGNISTYRIGNLLQYFMELLLWFLFNLCILFSFSLLLLKFIQHCSTIFTQETLNNFDDVISSNKSILIKVCT